MKTITTTIAGEGPDSDPGEPPKTFAELEEKAKAYIKAKGGDIDSNFDLVWIWCYQTARMYINDGDYKGLAQDYKNGVHITQTSIFSEITNQVSSTEDWTDFDDIGWPLVKSMLDGHLGINID